MGDRWDRQVFDRLASISFIDLSLGRVKGATLLTKFGRNDDVDTGTTPEDVWNGGGIYTGQPEAGVAETVTVTSDSANDTAAGTGARTAQLIGLDENWQLQFVDVALNGLGGVTTTELWQRVYRVRVLTAGTLRFNEGSLTVNHTTTTANVFSVVPPGTNRSAICGVTIPDGTTGVLRSMQLTAARNSGVDFAAFQLRIRETGGLYEVRDFQDIGSNAGSSETTFGGLVLPQRTDVVVRVDSVSSNNTVVTARLEYYLVDNEIFGVE